MKAYDQAQGPGEEKITSNWKTLVEFLLEEAFGLGL